MSRARERNGYELCMSVILKQILPLLLLEKHKNKMEQRIFISLPSHSPDLAFLSALTGTGSTGGSTETASLCLQETSQAFRIFIHWTLSRRNLRQLFRENASGTRHTSWN